MNKLTKHIFTQLYTALEIEAERLHRYTVRLADPDVVEQLATAKRKAIQINDELEDIGGLSNIVTQTGTNLKPFMQWARIHSTDSKRWHDELSLSLQSLAQLRGHLSSSTGDERPFIVSAFKDRLEEVVSLLEHISLELFNTMTRQTGGAGATLGDIEESRRSIEAAAREKPPVRRGRPSNIPPDIQLRIAKDYLHSGIPKREYPAAYPDRFRNDIVSPCSAFPKTLSPSRLETCLSNERKDRREKRARGKAGKINPKGKK
ncbi:MAG: hypothetical protein JXR25_11100 [Pontiellaceae bacterium]|nr:hypothetical protein [Pontiellaceae bacterium]MBN2785366.1 hypothetical protein [Pontiellaceae bacterium]